MYLILLYDSPSSSRGGSTDGELKMVVTMIVASRRITSRLCPGEATSTDRVVVTVRSVVSSSVLLFPYYFFVRPIFDDSCILEPFLPMFVSYFRILSRFCPIILFFIQKSDAFCDTTALATLSGISVRTRIYIPDDVLYIIIYSASRICAQEQCFRRLLNSIHFIRFT